MAKSRTPKRYFTPSGYSAYPQSGSYGGDLVSPDAMPPEEAETAPSGVDQYLQYLPFVRDIVIGKSAREEAAIIDAKIKNFQNLARNGGLLEGFYRNEIRKLKARAQVLAQQASEEETAQSIYTAGKVATVGTVVVGGLFLTGLAYWAFQQAALARAKRKAIQ